MIRVVFFLAGILVLAVGASYLADHPGSVQIAFAGSQYSFSTLVGFVALIATAVVLAALWSLLRLVFRMPSLLDRASAERNRRRGYKALSRGMVAVGSGDTEAARRYATEASRHLKHEPMALLLKAQSAQLSGDRDSAEQTFTAMLEHPETRTLALRGLYMEAVRRGDPVAALAHAEAAQKIATLPWSATALLQARVADKDWLKALQIVDRNLGARVIDRATANRQRAVLLTGLARDLQDRSPEEALDAAKDALRLEPSLVPAAAIAGRLLSRKGDYRRASKLLETAYAETPHPDLANAYLYARHGDTASDRLGRAETLAQTAPGAEESHLTVAHAALEARDFAAARAALAPLTTDTARPTRRTCLTMADVEEAEHGETGALYEWLQRASRAAPDPAWVADGVVSDRWEPLSPTTGRLDAFRWEVPQDLSRQATEVTTRALEPRHRGSAVAASTAALPAADAVDQRESA